MTTVYVLSETNFYRKELWADILSVHTKFESAYKELIRLSDKKYDLNDYYDLVTIDGEISVEEYRIYGSIPRQKLERVLKKGNIYDEGFYGTFIKDMSNGEVRRIYNDHSFTITPKPVISE